MKGLKPGITALLGSVWIGSGASSQSIEHSAAPKPTAIKELRRINDSASQKIKKQATQVEAVEAVLSGLHEAAARADFDRYFGYFSPKGIFLGTDAGERWTVEQFKDYARPAFSKGKGWTYTHRNRSILISDNRTVAWFDETLWNDVYGTCRGTGSLQIENGEWKIVQYSLSIPIPNPLARQVTQIIRKNKG